LALGARRGQTRPPFPRGRLAGGRRPSWWGSNDPGWPRRTGAHSARVAPAAGARTGWDGHLVPGDPPTRPPPSARWLAGSEHLYHFPNAAPGGVFLPRASDVVPHRHGVAQAEAVRWDHRGGVRHRSAGGRKKGKIEQAYTITPSSSLPVWCQDEAGPYQAIPQEGASWQPEGEPVRQPHE